MSGEADGTEAEHDRDSEFSLKESLNLILTLNVGAIENVTRECERSAGTMVKLFGMGLPDQLISALDASKTKTVQNQDRDSKVLPAISDFRFILRPDRNGLPTVVMTGSRYRLSNKPLRKLIPFISDKTKVEINVMAESELDRANVPTVKCDLTSEQLGVLGEALSDVSTEIRPRLRRNTIPCHHGVVRNALGLWETVENDEKVGGPPGTTNAARSAIGYCRLCLSFIYAWGAFSFRSFNNLR